ncbi:restriction endonuclease subunit S [Mycolicibacterium fortuitum]|uniref:Uncharacterized protein n=2 Tax=Mycolicibacterium fortuitum TaxID=1766 RepID=A0AAE4VGM9_MYCFO|nr:hypothetical protein [Mycolicibacterium fortuitum]MDV7194394.1 hypothetical protein [Mycolicibacterium fortuitum]MDV7207991.1 hypothetical protein [Mycolicibacterium fortuitum]MDV7229914.1 hypothetical protein [Mycolicibacterium fortuitum]MDV7261669.1 hypothetical protein [Mycolicibacterium fortuitum]MDV7286820.1 hypothetical protein [Mycolicibacterium fortuitum]
MIAIGNLLAEYKELPSPSSEPPVLTLTEKNGFVHQSDRFHKRLATEDVSKYKVVRRNDIAFNPYLLWAGAVAQNTIVDEGIISPLYPTFKVRNGFDPRYVARLLLSPQMISVYDTIAFGSVPRRRRSSVSDFLALEITDPPSLDEQRRIAAILDCADSLRTKRRQIVSAFESLRQSVFIDMFGDPASNPRGLPTGTIRDLVQSADYGTSEKSSQEGDIAVLRMNNVTYGGDIDLRELKYMTLPVDKYDRYTVRKGDVLFNRTNSADLVGKTAVYHGDNRLAYAGYLVRLRVHDGFSPDFLSGVLNSDYGKATLRGMCKSIVGMANINAKEVQTIRTLIPPAADQAKYSVRIERIRAEKDRHRAALAALDRLFESVQARAFRREP